MPFLIVTQFSASGDYVYPPYATNLFLLHSSLNRYHCIDERSPEPTAIVIPTPIATALLLQPNIQTENGSGNYQRN